MRWIYAHTISPNPTLYWRGGGQLEFTQVLMQSRVVGARTVWAAHVAAERRETVQFYLAGERGRTRMHEFSSSMVFLQDGHVFHYLPAESVGPASRADCLKSPLIFQSAILGEKRRIRIYLPRGYQQHSTRRYPVLYLNDGQNVFERGAYGTWAAHTKLDRLIQSGEIRELIVVAVDHGMGRFQDYVPPEDGGRCDRYASFLAEELKPYMDECYRTSTGPEETAVMGSSLGGLAAFYIAWNHPTVFGKTASLSGSWWLRKWRDRLPLQTKRALRCYIDSGDSGPANDCVQHTQALRSLLLDLGYQLDKDLMHLIGKRHTHTESAWGERIVHALRFLFPAHEHTEEIPLAA